MAVFELEAPDGKTYEVEGADAAGAVAALKKMQATKPVTLGDVGNQAIADVKAIPGKLWDAVKGIAQLPARTGEAAAEYGKTGEYNPAPFMEAATLTSPVNPAIRAGDKIIPGAANATFKEKAVVPGTQELKTAGAQDIKAGKNSGLDLTGQSIADYSRKIQREFVEGTDSVSAIHPVSAPNTFKILEEVGNAPPNAIFTAANLQTLREQLGTIAQNFNPNAAKDQLAASRAIKSLDNFLPSVSQKDILAGSPAATQQLFERGRGNYAAAMRSNDITGVLDRANTGILDRSLARAQSAHSGRNIDNTIRSKITSVLEKPKEVAGYTDPELAALTGAMEGGSVRNQARTVGNLLGGGGGIGSTLLAATGAIPAGIAGGMTGSGTTAALGALAGATPAIVGAGSRSVANALAKRDIKRVDEMLRKRSPMYEERVANAPMSVVTPEGRAALIRALLLGQQQ
jgi:hypothetical protein